MKRWLLALSLMTVTATTVAYAETATYFIDGNKLLEACSSTNQGFCLGYTQAIADYLNMQRTMNGGSNCIPFGVTGGQVQDVVVRYLRGHPENRHFYGSMLAVLAFGEAWCPQQPDKPQPQVNFK